MKKNMKPIKGLRNSINKIRKDIDSEVSISNKKKNKYKIKLPCLSDYTKDGN